MGDASTPIHGENAELNRVLDELYPDREKSVHPTVAAVSRALEGGSLGDALEADNPLARSDANNPKTQFGLRKPQLHLIPPSAMIEEAMVFRSGAEKYGPANWREEPVSASTYMSATLRHLMQWWDGEDLDPESRFSHLAHARSNTAILLDANASGTLIDDRPKPGAASQMIQAYTKES